MFSTKTRRWGLAGSAPAAALLAFSTPVAALAQQQTYQFNIPAQSLGGALRAFGQASNQQIMLSEDTVRGKRSAGLVGSYTAADALQRLLAGSGLTAERTTAGMIYLRGKTQAAAQGDEAAAVEPAQESASEVEEIVVTATRRDTGVQTTPVSIDVVTGKDLEKRGYVSIAQFLDSVPGVTSLDEGPGENRVIIRNVATSTQEAGSAVIATYFDDFPVSSARASAPDLRLVDMQQVEVLKGPQGTLFGRSAMGGILRYISNKPDAGSFSGGVNAYASHTTDGGDNYGGHVYLNVPMGDKLAVRAVAYSYQNSGFIDNVELHKKDANPEDTKGGRIALRWTPSDDLTLDLTYIYQDMQAASASVSTIHTPTGDIPYSVTRRDAVGGIVRQSGSEAQFFNFRLEKQFEPFTATLLATKAKENLTFVFDQREFVNLTTGCMCDTPERGDNGIVEGEVYELRLVSNREGRFDWLAGLYYDHDEIVSRQTIRYHGTPFKLYGVFPIADGQITIDSQAEGETSELAAYGELGFKITDQTRLAVGYRRSKVETHTISTRAEGMFLILTGATALLDVPFDTDESVNTYKFSLEHRFTDDIFGYALASSGYRRGGYNAPTAISTFSTYDSDSLWNYELGLKTRWLDGRLTANVSAYLLDFKDIQLVVQDPVTFARSTQNAGHARITGVELSTLYRPNRNFSFGFSGSLSNPELLEDVPGGVSGKKGDKLPGSATESFSLTADYNHPLAAGWSVNAGVAYKYVGSRLNDFNLDLDVELPSYQITDARIGVSNDKGLTLSLFAQNLFDEAVPLRIDRQGSFFESVPTNRPRTVGVNLTYDF
jgi:iron complex outermembrane receptor protein